MANKVGITYTKKGELVKTPGKLFGACRGHFPITGALLRRN